MTVYISRMQRWSFLLIPPNFFHFFVSPDGIFVPFDDIIC